MPAGDLIMQGMTSFGRDVGQGFGQYVAGAEKADALRGVMEAYAPKGPDGKLTDEGKAVVARANTMGLGDLEGYVQGQAVQQHMKQAAMQQQEMLARLNDYNAQTAQRTQQSANADEEASAFSNYAQKLHQDINNPDPNNADAVAFSASVPPAVKYQIAAAANVGKTNPRTAAAMIKPIMQMFGSSATSEDNTPQTMIGPNGETLFYQPHTKNSPVISPFTKSGARVQEIQAQGEATNSKGLLPEGTTFHTSENGMAFAELPDGSMKPLGKAPAAKADKASFFAKFLAPGSTNAPAGAAPPAGPTTPAYNSAADVKAAYKAGKLDKAAASKILQSQFGMQ